jgi:hypothetical protein
MLHAWPSDAKATDNASSGVMVGWPGNAYR